jgi:hypothetical protein
MGMIDLATINRLWKVSHDYQLSANKYLINGSSLTITSFHPASHNYQRMLTLLLIPKSLKHFRIINTLDSSVCSELIHIIGSIISRNCETLTSIDLSFDLKWLVNNWHNKELDPLYFSISMCSLLTTLKLKHVPLTNNHAIVGRLAKGCPRLQIIPWLKCIYPNVLPLSILGNVHYIDERHFYL